MINQGERIEFTGTFRKKTDGVWTEIDDITKYNIKARIYNGSTKTELIYSTDNKDSELPITIKEDNKTYAFSISPEITSTLVGECTCEIALVDNTDNPIISNDKACFTVKQSPLGKYISNK